LTSSGSFVNTHRFTGKEYENSGIYYFGARYYDPWLGRFLTPDPLGKFEPKDPKTINPYIYCSNNPLRYVDPTGRWRTSLERYAWAINNEFAWREFLSELGGGVDLVNCIVRKLTGDITLSTGDWLWAAAGILSFLIPGGKIADPVNRSIYRGLNWSFNVISMEVSSDVFKEVKQDKIIWKIAEVVGIVSSDGTIDLEAKTKDISNSQHLKQIKNFVDAMDWRITNIEELFPKQKYEKWYEIYYLYED